jgi:DNA-binding MarR family transcriptional regulator
VNNYTEAIKFYSRGDADYDLWILLTQARNLVFRTRELELFRYGLTPEQALILCIVNNSEKTLSPAEISRLTFRKPHTLSAMIERMEEKGLIKKTADPDRKNMIRITITEKGKKAYELTSKRGPIHRIMSSINSEEREDLKSTLEKIIFKRLMNWV